MRHKLYLAEFVARRTNYSLAELNAMVEDSIKMLSENKVLFEASHGANTDYTYRENAKRAVGHLKIALDRNIVQERPRFGNPAERTVQGYEDNVLFLTNLARYYRDPSNPYADPSFADWIQKNLDDAKLSMESGQEFQPTFASPEEKTKYLRHGINSPGNMPRYSE